MGALHFKAGRLRHCKPSKSQVLMADGHANYTVVTKAGTTEHRGGGSSMDLHWFEIRAGSSKSHGVNSLVQAV